MATCKQCGAVIHSYTYSGDFCTHTCAMSHAVEALTGERPAPASVALDGRVCAQCGYTYDCAAIHASHSRVTDDEIRLYSVSAACGHVGEMVCAIALGRKVEGVLGHLTPSAARALVELEIERLRAQGSM